jgi:antirestriction protein ArdC
MGFQETIREDITNKIVKSLEAGTSPWRKPWMTGLPVNLTSKKAYRGINVLLLSLHQHHFKHEKAVYATFNQWRDAGCMVKKRPEDVDFWGCNIVYFSPIKGKKTLANGDVQEYSFPLLKTYTVFNAEQVEGGKEYTEKRFPKQDGNAEPHEEAERVFDAYIQDHGIKYTEGGDRAYYSPSQDAINMPKLESFTMGTNSYYGTKFHEAIHSTGHEKRLDRLDKFARFGSSSYAAEELVAEIGGCFLMGALGLPVTSELENHASYLAHWLKLLKGDHKLIFQASAAASAAADMILKSGGLLEEKHEEEAVAV